MEYKSCEIKKMYNIDLSDTILYYITFKDGTKLMYQTDGIFNEHLDKDEWINFALEYKKTLTNKDEGFRL